MKSFYLLCFLFFFALAWTSADTPKARPDSHAPLGVMGDHGHKKRETMFSYRFMAMDMQGLQSGTTSLKPADVLKDFMMAPTAMQMYMHMFGAMFAPSDKITLMGMASYQQRSMKMERAHQHAHVNQEHTVGHHEMSSEGIGDTKLEGLLTFYKKHSLTLLGNVGMSFPTGSITQIGMDGTLLPYPMQLGSGSFEARLGVTLFGYSGSWSYGSQLRGIFPLHTNSGEYQHGNTLKATAWGARRVNNWISLSSRLLFSREGDIHGIHPDLNRNKSPSHRPDFRGGTIVVLAFSGNFMVPTGPLAGHRLAVEFVRPMYQNLTGIQLKKTWRLILGWQYGFPL